jgi:predicted dehydrogenase
MINISLLGAGYWGEKVAAELKNIKEVNNIEIIDIKNEKDIKDIQYNNVIIATPALDHYEQSINLLKQGKNLYVEKPLASTEQECLEIKKVINGQVLMVGQIFLYNDRLKKIKEVIDSGKIGKIKYIESNRLNWGRFQKKISTLLSLAPHDISIINYLLGYHEFKDINYKGVKISQYIQNDLDTFQFRCAEVDVKLNLSWYYPEKIRTIIIIGDNGMISWDEEEQTIKIITDLWNGNSMNYQPKNEILKIDSNPLKNELNDFVKCVINKGKPISDIDCAILIAKNLDLLTKSFI